MNFRPKNEWIFFFFLFFCASLPARWAYPLLYPEVSQWRHQRPNSRLDFSDFQQRRKSSNFRGNGYSDPQRTPQAEVRQFLDDQLEVGRGVRQLGPTMPVDGRSYNQRFSPQDRSSAFSNQAENSDIYTPGFAENPPLNGQARNDGGGGASAYRKPFDLVIPSYAYVPERYTGAMQYLPNPMIFAAGTPGAYIRDWNTYSDQFREQDVPVTPAYDAIWENLVAYIDGHPVNQSTSTTAASVKKLSQLSKPADFGSLQSSPSNLMNASRFKPCVSRRNTNRFGVCVDDSLVTQFCVGKSVAKSIICRQKQSCCLDSSPSDETEPSTNLPNKTIEVTQLSASIASIATDLAALKPCGTRAGGVTKFGICVRDELLGGLCEGKFISHSDHCFPGQSCCSDDSQATAVFQRLDTSTRPTTTSSTTARPVSARFQPCISNQNRLHGQLGICVNDSLLGEFCVNRFLAKSPNCESTQSCCIDANTDVTPSFSQPTPPPNIDSPSRKTIELPAFRPNTVRRSLVFVKDRNVRRRDSMGVANPLIIRDSAFRSCTTSQSTAIGICVPDLFVADQCPGKAVFRSVNCLNSQTCCVPVNSPTESPTVPPVFTTPTPEPTSSSNSPQQTTFVPCVSSENHVSIGICVDNSLVASLCTKRVVSQSENCFARQSCCTEMETNQEVILENPSIKLQVSDSKSVDLTLDSAVFTPCSTPRAVLQFGICVRNDLVSQLCVGQFISKTQDCTEIQTCCTADGPNMVTMEARIAEVAATPTTPTTRTTTVSRSLMPSQFVLPQVFQQCIPIVNNFQLGVCVSESQVAELCSGRMVAPSRSCGLAQSCCSYFPEASVPVTRVTTTPAIPLVPLDFSVDNAQNVLHQCAAGRSAVGVCVSEGTAMDYCQGKMISVSEDCSPMQLCCSEFG